MNKKLFFRRLSATLPYGYRRTSWLWPMTLGVGVGMLAGVSIGMLYAPRSGKETRQRLREGAERAQESARLAASRVRGQLEASAAEIREQARGSVSAPHYP